MLLLTSLLLTTGWALATLALLGCSFIGALFNTLVVPCMTTR